MPVQLPLPPVEDIGDLDQSPEPAPGGDTGPVEDGGTGNCETANLVVNHLRSH